MAYEGWLTLGDVEIINSSKTWHAVKAAGIGLHCDDDCPDLAYVLDDEPYQSSQVFPWSDDPTAPSGFLGFMGNKIAGLDTGVATRPVADKAGGGAAVGSLRRRRRELTVSVLAFALSEPALDYGIAWLNSVIRGSTCSGSCLGDTLCIYDQCPDSQGETIPADELHEAHIRNLFNVGVLEPPSVVSRTNLGAVCSDGGMSQAWMAEIQFMLVAGNPGIYNNPTHVAVVDAADWVLDTTVPVECFELPDCRTDFLCTPPPTPPAVPVPLDVCAAPVAGDYELVNATIPGSLMSDWFEKVPIITIRSGVLPIRSLSISFTANHRGLPCDELGAQPGAECDACETIYVPFIPRDGTLVIDGRTRSASLTCEVGSAGVTTSATTTGTARLYGKDGTLFTWPMLECGTDYCVRFRRADLGDPDLSSIDVYFAERRDSA